MKCAQIQLLSSSLLIWARCCAQCGGYNTYERERDLVLVLPGAYRYDVFAILLGLPSLAVIYSLLDTNQRPSPHAYVKYEVSLTKVIYLFIHVFSL